MRIWLKSAYLSGMLYSVELSSEIAMVCEIVTVCKDEAC